MTKSTYQTNSVTVFALIQKPQPVTRKKSFQI